MDYRGRQKKIEQALEKLKLEALLVTHMPNVRYLCGFTGSSGALLVGRGLRLFVTDGRYTAQAREEVKGARIAIARRGALAGAAVAIQKRKITRLGIEADHVTVGMSEVLGRMLPGVRLRPTSALVESVRTTKEPEEIQLIREAVLLGSRLFEQVVMKKIRPAVAEAEVAAELEYAARLGGAEGMSFETIVASGPRSALPHGKASACAIPAKGFVVLDFGVILAGYCSDMTRTVSVGRPSVKAQAMYEAVREAQQAGIEAVRPGATAGQVDAAARRVLRRRGWASYFTHSTGHGVGLEIHEGPRLGQGQKEVLQPGMVVTIEPGVYVPGFGGVRIEDMVVVTQRGCEVLTPATKRLLVL